jgi:signal transduction histidine kinase
MVFAPRSFLPAFFSEFLGAKCHTEIAVFMQRKETYTKLPISPPEAHAANAPGKRVWPLLAASFGALILLISLSGLALLRHSQQIQREVMETQSAYLEHNRVLEELRFQTLSLAIELRDYLLDDSSEASGAQQKHLLERRKMLLSALDGVDRLPANDAHAVAELRKQIDSYWDSVDAALHWTAAEKRARWSEFVKARLLPSREAVLDQASLLGANNLAYLDQRQNSLREALDDVQTYIGRVLALVLALGLAISGITIARIARLEHRAGRYSQDVEQVSEELRLLSQKLVQVQEAERKSLSRELHDEVGQMMTALRMELGNAEECLGSKAPQALSHLKAASTLAEQTLRSVRGLARGLRPSMLDELGLASALNWLAREYTKHTGIQVDLNMDGSLDHLPEDYSICIYRVVQEALTNCARHARAQAVHLDLQRVGNALTLTIQDDGDGFNPANGAKGIGLLGMKERVRELGGVLTIASESERGTLLTVNIPLRSEVLV